MMNDTTNTGDERGYNGWANRATWLVNLHLSNDQALAESVRDMVEQAYRDWRPNPLLVEHFAKNPDFAEANRIADVAEALREWIGEDFLGDAIDSLDVPEAARLLLGDLIADALGAVDWHEVARAFLPEGDDERAALLAGEDE